MMDVDNESHYLIEDAPICKLSKNWGGNWTSSGDSRINTAGSMNYKDGGRGIRTPGTVPRTVVFKTTGFNRSPIPPVLRILSGCGEFQILDGQIVFAVRLFGAEFQWGRQWIRMFDSND